MATFSPFRSRRKNPPRRPKHVFLLKRHDRAVMTGDCASWSFHTREAVGIGLRTLASPPSPQSQTTADRERSENRLAAFFCISYGAAKRYPTSKLTHIAEVPIGGDFGFCIHIPRQEGTDSLESVGGEPITSESSRGTAGEFRSLPSNQIVLGKKTGRQLIAG